MEYFIKDQFKESYTGNPMTELLTSVSSSLLDFSGVEVRYASDNENVVKFTEKDVVRHRLVQEIIKAYEKAQENSRG